MNLVDRVHTTLLAHPEGSSFQEIVERLEVGHPSPDTARALNALRAAGRVDFRVGRWIPVQASAEVDSPSQPGGGGFWTSQPLRPREARAPRAGNYKKRGKK